jgi:hypothetical protein
MSALDLAWRREVVKTSVRAMFSRARGSPVAGRKQGVNGNRNQRNFPSPTIDRIRSGMSEYAEGRMIGRWGNETHFHEEITIAV